MFKNTKYKRFISVKKLWIVLLIPILAFTLHKEYYSLTEIDYKPQEKSLQITIRLFTDDMELALENQFNKPIELGTEREIQDADKLMEIYLNQRFNLTIDRKKTSYKYIGKEFEKNVVYVYLEVSNQSSFKQIQVRNSILIDTYAEQENIVKINYLDQKRSMILTEQHEKEQVDF